MSILSTVINRIEKSLNIERYWRRKGVRIGKGCRIHSSTDFGSEPYLITLGDNVQITGGVCFIPHDGGVWVLRHLDDRYSDIDVFGPITVGDNVHIGTNTIIMPGVTIGSNCIIGCGAIVTKDIPDNSIAVGVPARVIKSVFEYEKQHQAEFQYTKRMTAEEKKTFLLEKYGFIE